jgi:hypothetical protein
MITITIFSSSWEKEMTPDVIKRSKSSNLAIIIFSAKLRKFIDMAKSELYKNKTHST